MDLAESIGSALWQLRDERGLSLREAAKRAGVNFSRLGEWERGVDAHSGRPIVPPRQAILDLARAYGAAADPLLALAGFRSQRDPTPQEERLLALFRRMPEPERQALQADLDARYGGT